VKFFLIVLSFLSCSPIEKKNPISSPSQNLEIGTIGSDPLRKNRGLYAEHYPASNERRIDLFWNLLDSLGGAYLGVGTDQNLSFAARAKSEYIFLVDFDPEIVKVNRLHIFFLKNAQNYLEFKNFWMRKNRESTIKFLQDRSGTEFSDLQIGFNIGLKPGIGVPERLQELDYMAKHFHLTTFSNDDDDFQFLRKRALENRIIAVNGDLTGSVTLKELSRKLSQAGLTINVFYTSNAEEYFAFPTNFRENIKSMPISEKSVLIRTITAGAKSMGYPDGEKYPDSFPFHYNYQKIGNLKKWMKYPKEFNIPFLLKYRTNIEKGFSKIEQDPPI
jgi:hypothetical protein